MKVSKAVIAVEIVRLVDLRDIRIEHFGEPSSRNGAVGQGICRGGVMRTLHLIAADKQYRCKHHDQSK